MSALTSPTYIQDQQILRAFALMPEGVRHRFRADFLVEMNRVRQLNGYSAIEQDGFEIWREHHRLMCRRNDQVRALLDYRTIQPGQSLAFAFTFTLAFAFALAFPFYTLAFTFAFAFAFAFEPIDQHSAPPNLADWNQIQQMAPHLEGSPDGFRVRKDKILVCAGKLNRDGTVELMLPAVSEEQAAQILAILGRG